MVHAHGPHAHKPYWQPIRDRFFSQPARHLGPPEDLTILTWNNGHHAMGLLEKSLDHLGVPYLVKGEGIAEWVNSRHKPLLTCEAAEAVRTKYLMGIDSRDAIMLDDPRILVRRFEREFSCELVFSADRVNWPNSEEFREFEESIPAAKESEFRFLNSGVWIGKTEFCRRFFAEAVRTEPDPNASQADQGIFKRLFIRHYPKVQLDYRCSMFQNIGFIFAPVLRLD